MHVLFNCNRLRHKELPLKSWHSKAGANRPVRRRLHPKNPFFCKPNHP